MLNTGLFPKSWEPDGGPGYLLRKFRDDGATFAGMTVYQKFVIGYTFINNKGIAFMWYVIHALDREDSLEARMAARPAHLERVQLLIEQGRLLVAGPMPNIDSPDPGPAGFSGSTIIAEFDSLDDARQWAGTDPYVDAGVYDNVDVRPFIKALP